MTTAAPQPLKTSRPLEAALGAELDRFERLALRYLSVLYGAGIVGALLIASTISRNIGLACAAAATAYLAWARFMAWQFDRGKPDERLRALNVAVEGSLPWVFAALLIFSEDAQYALASWVPPMMFCGLVVAYTARLQPRASIIVGILGGLGYPVVYFALAHSRLSEPALDQLLFAPPMQLIRSANLVIGGLLGAFIAKAVRAAILRAGVATREQDLFGKYRLVREIASGSLGNVYEALYRPEEGFERRVALKRLRPDAAKKTPFVEAFRREAAIGARLAHPNVAQVIDFGRVGKTYFMSLEFVTGATLARLRESTSGPFPPQVAGYVAREILAGLSYAHQSVLGNDGRPLEVVHGNASPENVLISEAGEVKVRDFGVARALRDAAGVETWTSFGHAGYLAPEQARGERVDARADLFPVGVILWELLAGQRLFAQDDEDATLRALCTGEIRPICELRPELHADWDALLGRALSRDRKQRFASAREMAEALRRIPGAVGEGAAGELGRMVVRARRRAG